MLVSRHTHSFSRTTNLSTAHILPALYASHGTPCTPHFSKFCERSAFTPPSRTFFFFHPHSYGSTAQHRLELHSCPSPYCIFGCPQLLPRPASQAPDLANNMPQKTPAPCSSTQDTFHKKFCSDVSLLFPMRLLLFRSLFHGRVMIVSVHVTALIGSYIPKSTGNRRSLPRMSLQTTGGLPNYSTLPTFRPQKYLHPIAGTRHL